MRLLAACLALLVSTADAGRAPKPADLENAAMVQVSLSGLVQESVLLTPGEKAGEYRIAFFVDDALFSADRLPGNVYQSLVSSLSAGVRGSRSGDSFRASACTRQLTVAWLTVRGEKHSLAYCADDPRQSDKNRVASWYTAINMLR